jgi:hypothetical protein
MFARRSRTAAARDLGWAEVQHRWTDGTWDCALTVYDDQLAPGAVDALTAQVRQPPPA